MNSPSRIAERIEYFRNLIPEGVSLVAVSKFHPAEAIMAAYEAGQKIFGESRVQEFLEKLKVLPEDIRWHFIGHLQTNKVKPIIGKTSLIESVDSVKLLETINKESYKAGVTTSVLMQVHVALEETKFGFDSDELLEFFRTRKFSLFPNVKIRGVMGMASNTDDTERVRADFRSISRIFNDIKEMWPEESDFDTLSMGMSGDWPIAVEEGANMVRIGGAIFGERN